MSRAVSSSPHHTPNRACQQFTYSDYNRSSLCLLCVVFTILLSYNLNYFGDQSTGGVLRDSTHSIQQNVNPIKRRMSTGAGIMKVSSTVIEQQPKTRRRNVSFGGAHVRTYEKTQQVQIAPPVVFEEDEQENDDMEMTRSHTGMIVVPDELLELKNSSQDESDMSMELTKSHSATIQLPSRRSRVSFIAGDLDESDMSMEMTRSHTSQINMPQQPQESVEEDDENEMSMEMTRSHTGMILVPDKIVELKDNSHDESDTSMEMTRSHTGVINVIQPLQIDEEDEAQNDEVTMEFTQTHGAIFLQPPVSSPIPEENTQDLSRNMSFSTNQVYNIIQGGATESTSDLANYYKNAGEQTKEVAALYRGIINNPTQQTPTGEIAPKHHRRRSSVRLSVGSVADETMDFTRTFPSNIQLNPRGNVANNSEDADDDIISFKPQGCTDDLGSAAEETMNFTRSYTTKIVTVPVPSPAKSMEIDSSVIQDDSTMDFTRSFTAAIVTNPVVAAAALSPLKFPSGANSEDVTMEFTRSFTSAIVAPKPSPTPRTPLVATLLPPVVATRLSLKAKQLPLLSQEVSDKKCIELRNEAGRQCAEFLEVNSKLETIKAAQATQKTGTPSKRKNEESQPDQSKAARTEEHSSPSKATTPIVEKYTFNQGRGEYEMSVEFHPVTGDLISSPTIAPTEYTYYLQAPDAPFIDYVHKQVLQLALQPVLDQFTNRNDLALVEPQISRLLTRLSAVRDELKELRCCTDFEVRTDGSGKLEVNIWNSEKSRSLTIGVTNFLHHTIKLIETDTAITGDRVQEEWNREPRAWGKLQRVCKAIQACL